ncbi:MAG: MdtA/MuxA family multidrug efflux RND transporter periplasmic adaptor subunit [Formivibrio sp.]|nr:MdtA/MuxA family multidrug efflux RND transporter periplasmic adaptor subunit [Formivibrio sp.]
MKTKPQSSDSTEAGNESAPLAPRPQKSALWVYGVVIVIAIGTALYVLKKQPAPATSPVASTQGTRPGRQVSPVVALATVVGDMPVRLSALGTVSARNTATVRVQVSGRLQQVLFHEGQLVKAGQVLARIDPRSFQAQVDSAAAQLAKDQAQLGAAQTDLKRYQTLLAQNSIASQQVDTQAALVSQLTASIAADHAALEQAKLQLSYTQVTAPISGRVGLRQIDAGNLVQTSDSNGLVVITEVHPISVVFPLPQQQLQAVLARQKTGEPVSVEAWDADNRKQLGVGKLVSLDNLIDPATGTIKLKAEFANDDDQLFPNQFVNVHLTVDTLKQVVLAPTAAVQPGANGSFVFVVNESATGNTVSMRPVQTGPSDSTQVAVLKGLKVGERVVTDGVDRVRDGASVQVMAKPDTPSPAAGNGRRGKRRGNASAQGSAQ